MARPLRLDIPDGWYHTMSRGTERRDLFLGDRDCIHFLELLERQVERYGVALHAYVLMGNHYHLLVQTPAANLSRAMQWLNVSYGVWFNRKYNRVGPLFQGRFKAVPVDGEGSWALQESVYLHLNPVRVKGLGLDKRGRKAEGRGMTPPPSPELVKARLDTVRGHRWSSYRAYAGYVKPPSWLTCDVLWERARREGEAAAESYRWIVEAPLVAGVEVPFPHGARMAKALVMGSEGFIARLRAMVRGDRSNHPDVRKWQRLLPFGRVISAVESMKGEPWERFRDRYGDEGRDMVLWLGRQRCGMTHTELSVAVGGMSAVAVSSAVRTLESRRRRDGSLRDVLACLEEQLAKNET